MFIKLTEKHKKNEDEQTLKKAETEVLITSEFTWICKHKNTNITWSHDTSYDIQTSPAEDRPISCQSPAETA